MNISRFFAVILIAALAAAVSDAAVFNITGDTADRHIGLDTSGTPVLNNVANETVSAGGSNWKYNQADNAGILVFELPDLGGQVIESADLSVKFSAAWVKSTGSVAYDPADTNILWSGHPGSTDTSMPKWCDLYGLRYDTASSVLTNDYGYKTLVGAGDTLIQTQFLYKALSENIGLESAATDAFGDARLTTWLQAQYDAGAVAGDYVFLRIHAMFDTGNPFATSSADSTNQPVLTITTGVGAARAVINASPVSGITPLTVSFTDISTGSITNRFWDFGDGSTTNTTLTSMEHTYVSPGIYTVALTVYDDIGSNSTDTIQITVNEDILNPEIEFTEQPSFVDNFSAGWETTQSDWRVATWLQNGTQMSKDRCKTDGLGNMVQTVLAGGPPYYGGSMQSSREFGYGRWVARIKPTAEPGVLNSFFTKDWDDLTTSESSSDGSMAEVDIELLSYTFGVNTGEVHIAIHLDGRDNYMSENIGLNFNPSDDFHEWGFDILPDRVVWHVDGNPFYAWMYDFEDDAYVNENYECFMNSWTMVNWILGPPAADADYLIDWVKFYPVVDAADSDNDGLPDSWETTWFGGTNANPAAMASNGINTVIEAYIAGLDPTDPDARFTVSSDWKTLQWNAASGRVYSVYWTTNLLSGFQPLETNLLWPQNSWTSPASAVEAFYKLTVEMD